MCYSTYQGGNILYSMVDVLINVSNILNRLYLFLESDIRSEHGEEGEEVGAPEN